MRPSRRVTALAFALVAGSLIAGCDGGSNSSAPPPPQPRLEIAAGDTQSADAGQPLADSLAVRAVDASGAAEGNVLVRWTATGTAIASPESSFTAANGIARTRLTLGATPGSYTVTAQAAGRAPVQFSVLARTPAGTVNLALQPVASGLTQPLFVTAPAGDSRVFVVEQVGRVRIVQNGLLLAASFLDIRNRVIFADERGLLSVAFDPKYAQNGYFYVDYIDTNGNTQVDRYTVSSGDPNVADTTTRLPILGVTQPYTNHNGGLLLFGTDSLLYVGLGDGGSAGDPQGYGQNQNTLLGKILRLDVRGATAQAPYAIPAGNPFVGQAGKRGEIWAYGLRNPWRFSFDRVAGRLYIGDVGQNREEEIDIADAGQAGLNYGWNTMEASLCYPSDPCSSAGLVLPRIEYDHSASGGCAVTGGYVYRGTMIPEIVGHYFYSDYCSGWLHSFRFDGTRLTDFAEWNVPNVGNISSFGEDAAGELYLTSFNGTVYRLVKQ
jgi:glucose/arabinose dehydrogenase